MGGSFFIVVIIHKKTLLLLNYNVKKNDYGSGSFDTNSAALAQNVLF